MKEADIRTYANLMKELELTGLEITEDSTKVRLERAAQGVPREITYAVPETVGQQAVSPENKDYTSVTSALVGVFYAAPSEDAKPFVSVGDAVKKGQTLCIVEAMKLMNEITAEEDGIISDICVKNGQVVEYGTELFRIKN